MLCCKWRTHSAMSTMHPFHHRFGWTFSVPHQQQQLHIYGFTPKACVRPCGRFSVSEFFLNSGESATIIPAWLVSVIMVMCITGRNEFKCFVRLFELWFPICGSSCCLCVLSHVVTSDEHKSRLTCRGVRRTRPASPGDDDTGCFFSLLWLQLLSQESVFSFSDAANSVCF